MAEKRTMLTQDGYDKLVAKLDHLKSVRRIEVANRLKAAIALGDLSENSEYEDAKNEQAFLEGEIFDLETQIANSQIIQNKMGGDSVDIGSTVVIHEVEEATEKTYGRVSNIYKLVDGKPVEIEDKSNMETDIFKIVDSESLEVGNDKVYKLVNITIEDMTDKVGNSTESLYRSIEGALVQLNSTNEEGKIYKVTEGTSDDIYGKVEQIYKVYKVVDEDEKYMIVGSTETNPDDFKISDESPLGSALMGKKAGNIAEVHAPIGIILYEIVKIES